MDSNSVTNNQVYTTPSIEPGPFPHPNFVVIWGIVIVIAAFVGYAIYRFSKR